MVEGMPYSIHIEGNGNVVAGRDINLGSNVFSVTQVPLAYRDELAAIERLVRSQASRDSKREKVQSFAARLAAAGFGGVAKAVAAHLLALV